MIEPTPPGEEAITVVFAEDNYLLREGTAALLREVDGIELLESVDGPEALIASVQKNKPSAVITDIRMPPGHSNEGIEAARQIKSFAPETGVLLLSQYVEHSYVQELLEGGVSGVGYLLKERVRDVGDLVATLRSICRGGLVLDPKVVDALMVQKRRTDMQGLGSLTEKEMQVLEQMAQGRTNAAITRTLFMSNRSVERHINSIFSKLGLTEEQDSHKRVRAVLAYLENDPGQAG